MSKIEAITSIDKVDYIIVNHTEPDHSGSVAKLLELNPNITVVGSPLAIKYLSQLINTPFKSLIVKQNDTLSLGNKTLSVLDMDSFLIDRILLSISHSTKSGLRQLNVKLQAL